VFFFFGFWVKYREGLKVRGFWFCFGIAFVEMLCVCVCVCVCVLRVEAFGVLISSFERVGLMEQ
jgi:hypothetical protein